MTGNRLAGRATPEGTRAFADAHADALKHGFYRKWRGLTLSTLGAGTYLGDVTADASRAYEEAVLAALESGVNVIDCAINYRDQQSERDVGAALQRFGERDRVLVTTKGGFVAGDATSGLSAEAYIGREYVDTGMLNADNVAGGVHSLDPAFLEDQLDRSLTNLGLDAVDVYFVHNPETQLMSGVPPELFAERLRDAFEVLERAVDAGRIGTYGLATWHAFRVAQSSNAYVPLEQALEIAAEARAAVGGRGADHHFGAIELPVNLAMAEAGGAPVQQWKGERMPVLEAAREADLLVLASATLMQTRLLGGVPDDVKGLLNAEDDATAAMQFTRSVPGVTTALVGMGSREHARANAAALAARAPVPEAWPKLLARSE